MTRKAEMGEYSVISLICKLKPMFGLGLVRVLVKNSSDRAFSYNLNRWGIFGIILPDDEVIQLNRRLK
jgi:hypothetical protein